MGAKNYHKHKGFTLIEMSIVLVIIGLIVGGILTGRELIYAASLRKLGSEMQQWKTALITFESKYNCIPGDCNNAETFFGTNSAGCPNGGGPTGTCNGNADGVINDYFGYGNVENLYARQQLSLAKLIPWTLPVTTGGTALTLTIGSNIAPSSFNPNIGYDLLTQQRSTPLSPNQAEINHIIVQLGAKHPVYPDVLWGSGLNAVDAKALDMKVDDGNPNSGALLGATPDQPSAINPYPNCTVLTSGIYSYIATSASGCIINYIIQ